MLITLLKIFIFSALLRRFHVSLGSFFVCAASCSAFMKLPEGILAFPLPRFGVGLGRELPPEQVVLLRLCKARHKSGFV